MKVGSLVILNQHGLESVFGDSAREAYAAGYLNTKIMRITDIDPAPLCEDDSGTIHSVEVDDPYINQFLIDTACFDVVLEAANEDNGVQLPTNMTQRGKELVNCDDDGPEWPSWVTDAQKDTAAASVAAFVLPTLNDGDQ